MMPSFLEMAFSLDGLHPLRSKGVYVSRSGTLYSKNLTGEFEQLFKRDDGSYRFFAAPFIPKTYDDNLDVPVLIYEVIQDDIEEYGIRARAHLVDLENYYYQRKEYPVGRGGNKK